jgi:hypothetical protein
MAMTNAEKQARWREKHIQRRRYADRVATLLVRTNWPEGHVEEIAAALRDFFSTAGIAALRKALKPMTEKETEAFFAGGYRRDRALWIKEHPGKKFSTRKLLEWRGSKAKQEFAAERAEWEHDHPGQEYSFPKHDQRKFTDLERWERQRERRLSRNPPRPGALDQGASRPAPQEFRRGGVAAREEQGRDGSRGRGMGTRLSRAAIPKAPL